MKKILIHFIFLNAAVTGLLATAYLYILLYSLITNDIMNDIFLPEKIIMFGLLSTILWFIWTIIKNKIQI
jgi:hypothetical protein